MRIIKLVIFGVSFFFFSCNKDLQPYNSKSDATALETVDDINAASMGSYGLFKTLNYERELWWLMIYPSDDCALSGSTTNSLYNAYTYIHFPAQANTTHVWQQAYAAIYSANRIIDRISDGTSVELDQIKGENLFLRALSHFFLVRLFGRPYSQDGGASLGIPIKSDVATDDLPARNSVKEVYNFIVTDLIKASDLMTDSKDSRFASKEVAYAFLSRVYLYEGKNDSVVYYANKVIDSHRYSLMSTDPYRTYFVMHPEDNPETIFAIRNVVADNYAKSGIGNQFYNDPVTHATGYAETYASMSLVKLLNRYPEDVRHSFIELQLAPNGDTLKRNGVPQFFVNKFNWQDGIANLSSPVVFRLAEMYLNRAEANAKIGGHDEEVIEDVNLIRRRAGLSGSALYSVDDLKGHNTVLEVVLEERQLEFFFEGQRVYDIFRNNLPLVRDYEGFHGTDHFHFTVNPDDPRVVFLIPEYSMLNNPNLVQNPI